MIKCQTNRNKKVKLNVTYLNPSFCLPWFGEVELKEVVMFTIGGNGARLEVHSNLRFVFLLRNIKQRMGWPMAEKDGIAFNLFRDT